MVIFTGRHQLFFQFFVRPTKTALEHVATDENIDGRVEARINLTKQNGEYFFGNAFQDGFTPGLRPRFLQVLSHISRHQLLCVKEIWLLVLFAFAKQGTTPGVSVPKYSLFKTLNLPN